jgi:hypothetical protein
MRWIRSHVTFGGWCALFALAVQLTLSFGHVHSVSRGLFGATNTERLALQSLPVLPDGAVVPVQPSRPDPNGAPDDYCAICALIHLAGTMAPAVAPSLPLPVVFTPVPFTLGIDRDLAAVVPHSFQARGPPIA